MMGHVLTATHSLNTFTGSASSRMVSIEGKTGSYATTGSNTFVGLQTIQGSIVPSAHATYDLGSAGYNFRHLYLSSASLYIDGTKVLGSTTQELQITTDNGQSFKILEAGSDTITLQSNDGNITLATSGGGDVILDPTTGIIALKGTTQVYSGNKVRSSDGNNIVFGDGLTVSGSVTITGFIEAQELRTTYISSSILYRSGSTKFGDELTDTHTFTGSLLVSGSISVPGSGLISGSSQILNGSGVWSGSAQLPSGVVSGSSQISFTGTTGYSTYINQAVLSTSAPTFTGLTISPSADVGSTNFVKKHLIGNGGFGGGYTSGTVMSLLAGYDGSSIYGTDIGYSYDGPGNGYSLHFSTNDDTSGNPIQRMRLNHLGYLGINRTDPSFYLDVYANVANSLYTIAQFENRDYTAGTRSFIRVRNWLSAGGSYSSYFGQGQDGKTYIIANNSGRGGDIVIDGSNGFVGINRSSPGYRFDIYDSAPSGGILANLESGNASGWFRLRSTGSTWQMGATTNGLEFYNENNAATRVTIAPNGKVGIGETTPDNTYQGLTIKGGDPSVRIKTTSASGWTWIEYVNSSGVNTWSSGVNHTASYFAIKAGAGLDSPTFVVTSGGSVGVGVSNNPTAKLHISGSGGRTLRIDGPSNTDNYLSLHSGTIEVFLDADFTNTAGIVGTQSSHNMYLRTGGTDKACLTPGGNFGIGNLSPGSKLVVSGANTGSTPLVDLTASGTGTYQRGVRLLNSGMNSGDHIMYAVGRSDNSRNMGQTYFYFAGDNSTSNRLSFGLHSVDDVMHVQGNATVTIGGTGQYSASKLAVEGALKVNRTIYNWFQAGTNDWDGYAFLHLKTNMWAGGSPNGNIHYTMSLFHAKLYSYSSPYVKEGNMGFHNWSGTHYSIATSGNVWTTAYTSSDGYTVLVISLGSGSYMGVTIDWHQAYGYPFQDKSVTTYARSNSSSGVY